VLAHVALLWALPFPAGNEPVYMASLQKSWDRRFLAGDWTFSGGFPRARHLQRAVRPALRDRPIAVVA
jgi:hypothetical protein